MQTPASPFTMITAEPSTPSAWFGSVISIDGKQMIVGAHNESNASGARLCGAVYIFENQAAPQVAEANWVQVARLQPADVAGDDRFGTSVAISGGYAAVGAPQAIGNNNGYMSIYKKRGSTWDLFSRFDGRDAFGGSTLGYFGISLALSNEYLVVGAPNVSDTSAGEINLGHLSGGVSIYKNTGANWEHMQTITFPGLANNAHAGKRVSLAGDVCFVSAPSEQQVSEGISYETGAVIVLQLINNEWRQVQKIYPPLPVQNENFGDSLAADLEHVLIGSKLRDDRKGKVFVYKKSSDINSVGANNWEYMATLASPKAEEKAFGAQVSLDFPYLLVSNASEGLEGPKSVYFWKFKCNCLFSGWDYEELKFPADDTAPGSDMYGYGLALEWPQAMLGSPRRESRNGAVYNLYKWRTYTAAR